LLYLQQFLQVYSSPTIASPNYTNTNVAELESSTPTIQKPTLGRGS